MTEKKFHFEHKGIGKLLKDERLIVPPNQRSYAWEIAHVRELLGAALLLQYRLAADAANAWRDKHRDG